MSTTIIVLLTFISLNNALPTNLTPRKGKSYQSISPDKNDYQKLLVPVDYASEASQLIAINLLKSNNDIDGNQVHSSLGITTMLAILAEASDGSTYEEFVRILHYPEKRNALKKSYKGILAKYQTRVYGLEPSFQTWLYVYRNFTIREDFRHLLRNYYYVDVKDINRDEYDWSEPNTSLELESLNNLPSKHDNSKDVIGFETLKSVSSSSTIKTDYNTTQLTTSNNSTIDGYGEEFVEKETSKLDRIVDDKQYVEKPQLFAEIKHQQQQQISNISTNTLESTTAIVLEIDVEKKAAKSDSNNKQTESSSEMLKPVPITNIDLEFFSKDATTASTISSQTVTNTTKRFHLNLEENETVQDSEKLSKHPIIKVNAPNLVITSLSTSSTPPVTTLSTMFDLIGEQKMKQELYSLSPVDDTFFTTMPSATTTINDNFSSSITQVVDKPKKNSLPLDKLVNVLEEASKVFSETSTMMSLESHVSTARSAFGDRSLFRRDDITSALSANSITGRDAGTKSKMLLFNGLYYRGNWAMPFLEVKNNDYLFYITKEDVVKTPMMYTKGRFHMTRLLHLNARVLCLPYQNKHFSIMLVIPDELDGLHEVITKLQTSDFQLAKNSFKERDLHIVMPKYHIEETSRSETMLKTMGFTKLFSRRETNLNLLSDDHDLHVDEIVQFVSIRVDEGGISEAGLSALDIHSRNTEKTTLDVNKSTTTSNEINYELLLVNRPFLYFVMDCEREFVLVSGKVYAPELPAELAADINIDIEFNQS